jgi:3-isopropylmalate/(R)-2-methylmalate dehydratase small subunit
MIITGSVLPVDRPNIDTDQIIPARFLTGITKTGLGQYLLSGFPGGGELLAAYPEASIVVTRENFGCGSSREHAAWALVDRGFKAVIAPSFARIFHENAYNNAIVPVILTPEEVERCITAGSLTIDVTNETVTLPDGTVFNFKLDVLRKQFILGGGFMGYLASKIDQVRAWEAAQATVKA